MSTSFWVRTAVASACIIGSAFPAFATDITNAETVSGQPACITALKLAEFQKAIISSTNDQLLRTFLSKNECIILNGGIRVQQLRQTFDQSAPAGAYEFKNKNVVFWTLPAGLRVDAHKAEAVVDAKVVLPLIPDTTQSTLPSADSELLLDFVSSNLAKLDSPEGLLKTSYSSALGSFQKGTLIEGVIRFADGMIAEGKFSSAHSGIGKISYPDGRIAEGSFKNWKLHGEKCSYYKPNVYTATGSFRNGLLNGRGTKKTHNKILMSGMFIDGVLHGDGVIEYPDGSIAKGQFQNNALNGQGQLNRSSGAYSSGTFVNNQLSGVGVMKTNATMLSGSFLHDRLNGQGKITYSSGTVLSGEFLDGKLNGEGVIEYPSKVKISGTFKNNVLVSKATKTYPNGTVFVGQSIDLDLSAKL